jgi:hypothetical protein
MPFGRETGENINKNVTCLFSREISLEKIARSPGRGSPLVHILKNTGRFTAEPVKKCIAAPLVCGTAAAPEFLELCPEIDQFIQGSRAFSRAVLSRIHGVRME